MTIRRNGKEGARAPSFLLLVGRSTLLRGHDTKTVPDDTAECSASQAGLLGFLLVPLRARTLGVLPPVVCEKCRKFLLYTDDGAAIAVCASRQWNGCFCVRALCAMSSFESTQHC